MSKHGRAKILAYSKTEKAKKAKYKYVHSPKGHANYIRGQNKYRKTAHGRFMLARKSALMRKKAWTLTEVEYGLLMAKPCFYCGISLNPTGVGLDRLDNKEGYISINVVPCCGTCNCARGDWWTPGELKAAVTAVAVYRQSSNNRLSSNSGPDETRMYESRSLPDVYR